MYGNGMTLYGVQPNMTCGSWNRGYVGQAAALNAQQQIAVNQTIAQRDADALTALLNAPLPTLSGGIHTEVDCPGHQTMQPHSADFNFGSGKVIFALPDTTVQAWADHSSYVSIPAKTKLTVFRGRNFTGESQTINNPNNSNFLGCTPFSGFNDPAIGYSFIAVPSDLMIIDNEGKINQAWIKDIINKITSLAKPENGCLVNATNFKSFPAVAALMGYFDRVSQAFQGTPYQMPVVQAKQDTFNDLFSNILANPTCVPGGVPAPAPVAPPTAPAAACPTGRYYKNICVPQNLASCQRLGIRYSGKRRILYCMPSYQSGRSYSTYGYMGVGQLPF